MHGKGAIILPNKFKPQASFLSLSRIVKRGNFTHGFCKKKGGSIMSFYDLEFKDTKGKVFKMKQFKGKVLLIVNTATRCGYTPQFVGLEALYQKYKGKGFNVIGFPCNQFANEEPESNETMVQTCKIKYGVTFLLSEKIDVNGKNTHPVFEFLKNNSKSGLLGNGIKWNFTKFLVSKDGEKINRYSPNTQPSEIEKDIIQFLK